MSFMLFYPPVQTQSGTDVAFSFPVPFVSVQLDDSLALFAFPDIVTFKEHSLPLLKVEWPPAGLGIFS